MPEFSYALTLYTNVLNGGNFVRDITSLAGMWNRSIRLIGGYWQGTFRVTGEPMTLSDWYDNWLGYHVEEYSEGEKTWEGMIYEMTFNDGRTSRRRSLDDMYNHITATYLSNASTRDIGETTPVTNAESIARYGRREDRLSLDNTDEDPAIQRCNAELKWNAWAWSRAVGGDFVSVKSNERMPLPTLEVTVCGYVFTINWRFTTTANDSTDDLSDWINDIIDTDSEYCQPGTIQANTTQIKRTLDMPQRSWDQILKLVALGDSSFNPYCARVLNDRYLEYEALDFNPYYFVINGQIARKLQTKQDVNPWKVRPACFRDMSYPTGKQEYGSPYLQASDFFPEEIRCGVESGVSWSATDYDETEMMAAQEDYNAWLKDQSSGGGSGGSAERLNWKRRLGLVPGTPEWEAASKLSGKEKQEMIENYKRDKGKQKAG